MSEETPPTSEQMLAVGVPQVIVGNLDALEAMFDTEGWRVFVNDMRAEHIRLSDIDQMKTWEDVLRAKAQRDLLDGFINMPLAVQVMRAQAFRAATEEDDAE